ncbi:MAG TPA: TlyA family rRNA (cytidine-2'-O)-methyltransferase [Candidatus Aminicenantes bacterium]|nr:TlyA family rRNA (cytidine-2'-O)-methyltransferase [Candidatus Aminicenantes bacterium]
MIKRERADKLVLNQGLAQSREKAQALIMAGLVTAGGRKVEKPGELLDTEVSLAVRDGIPYVSRGGLKLAEALEAFAVRVAGKVAADLGASTGGFTDCLLQRGARVVYAVDVSTSQLDWRLRRDPRVVPLEKNARYLSAEDFPERPGIVTVDLSFISVLKVLPAVRNFLAGGDVLCLLKPQFEVGRGQVGKRGVVRNPLQHEGVLNQLLQGARELGFGVRGLHGCKVRGQRGNREFFVYWMLTGPSLSPDKARELVREVVYG